MMLGSLFLKGFIYFEYRKKVYLPTTDVYLVTGSRQQHTGWGHPFWPLVLCLWQLQDNDIMVQLWVKTLNGTFSKFRLGKLGFKAGAESQKILCSGSAKAWSLSAFQDNLIWESKGCQSPMLQRNSANESGDSGESPADRSLPGFAKLSIRPSLLTILTKCQTLPWTSELSQRLSFPFSEVQS